MTIPRTITINAIDLMPGDCFWVNLNEKYRVVKEIFYSGGGCVGFRNYEGVYIVLTQCGFEVLVKRGQKVVIKIRRKYVQKITEVNWLVRQTRD